MQKNRLYIAYGSNLNLPQMAQRCPGASVVGAGEVRGYELVFRGGEHSAVATIEPMEGGRVPVLLWNIQPQDELALNRYEGYPRLYRQEVLEAELGGRPTAAMVYLMNEGHDYGAPSDYYLRTIAEGYQSAGFDPEILDRAVEKSLWLAQEQQAAQADEYSLWGQKWW